MGRKYFLNENIYGLPAGTVIPNGVTTISPVNSSSIDISVISVLIFSAVNADGNIPCVTEIFFTPLLFLIFHLPAGPMISNLITDEVSTGLIFQIKGERKSYGPHSVILIFFLPA